MASGLHMASVINKALVQHVRVELPLYGLAPTREMMFINRRRYHISLKACTYAMWQKKESVMEHLQRLFQLYNTTSRHPTVIPLDRVP